MMSPGSSVIVRESHATSSAGPKIRLAVVPFWSSSPLIRVRRPSAFRSSISSSVTSAGPHGAKVSIALPLVHSGFLELQVAGADVVEGHRPGDVSQRILCADVLAVRPITRASSAS